MPQRGSSTKCEAVPTASFDVGPSARNNWLFVGSDDGAKWNVAFVSTPLRGTSHTVLAQQLLIRTDRGTSPSVELSKGNSNMAMNCAKLIYSALAVTAAVAVGMPERALAVGYVDQTVTEIRVHISGEVFVAYSTASHGCGGGYPNHFYVGNVNTEGYARSLLSLAQAAVLSGRKVNMWASTSCYGGYGRTEWIAGH